MSTFVCDVCNKTFNNASTFRSHKSLLANPGKCKISKEIKRAQEVISKFDTEYLADAVEKKQKNERNEDLKSMMINDLKLEIERFRDLRSLTGALLPEMAT